MSGNGVEDNNLPWDDSLLIKSYEKSLKFSREELARRIADKTNTNTNTSCPKEMPEQIQQENEEIKAETDADAKYAVASDIADVDENVSVSIENAQPTPSSYIVGEYARATYDVDGIDYEATITSIDEKKETCSLRYIGYDNVQVVKLSDLVPSWGKEARRLQLFDAHRSDNVHSVDNVVKHDGGAANKMTPKATFDQQSERKKHKSSKKAKQQQQQQQQKATIPNMENFGMLGMSTPPPPLPPLFDDNIHDNSEHLSAMLMSWYMSGYYTGVYQGMQMAAKKTQHQQQQQQQNKDKVNK